MIAFMTAVVVTDSLYADFPTLRKCLADTYRDNSDGRGMSGQRNAVRMLGSMAADNGCRWAIPARV